MSPRTSPLSPGTTDIQCFDFISSGGPDMAGEEHRVTAHIREQLRSARWLLEETLSDVTDEMAHFAPPGKALSRGDLRRERPPWEKGVSLLRVPGTRPASRGI